MDRRVVVANAADIFDILTELQIEAQIELQQEPTRAEGEANRTIAEAEGYATERVNGALGETARFRSILSEYRSAPEVTRTMSVSETPVTFFSPSASSLCT